MIEELFSLQGKKAVVTGGAKGLGALISKALLVSGVDVYITSRNAKDCHAFADDMNLRNLPGRCVALPFDLSDLSKIECFSRALKNHESKIDILINNAGVTWGAAIGEFPEKGWDRVMDINLKSPFFLVQSLLPLLQASARADSPARIINIGSSEGLHAPMLGNFSYSASKAGLHHLTKHLARHFASFHINVNAIAPGAFMTNMMQKTSQETKDMVINEIPLRRMGGEGDIEGGVVYLCSRAGNYVTGTVLPVDGGWSGCV